MTGRRQADVDVQSASVRWRGAREPSLQLLAYAAAKGAISNFTAALAQMLADRGIRVNAVAPGPDLDAAHPFDDAGGE